MWASRRRCCGRLHRFHLRRGAITAAKQAQHERSAGAGEVQRSETGAPRPGARHGGRAQQARQTVAAAFLTHHAGPPTQPRIARQLCSRGAPCAAAAGRGCARSWQGCSSRGVEGGGINNRQGQRGECASGEHARVRDRAVRVHGQAAAAARGGEASKGGADVTRHRGKPAAGPLLENAPPA